MGKLDKKDNNRANDTYKKAQETPCVPEDKELERMLELSKYRYASSLNKKDYSADKEKHDKKILRKIYIIFWEWFFFSICFGWILCGFIKPPDFFLNFYSNYMGYVKEYDLFCMSMMLAVLTFPLVFLLLFFEMLKIAKIVSWWLKIASIVMAVSLLYFTTGLDGLGPIGRGGGRGDPRTLAALLFDWSGVVLLNLFLLAFFAFAVATSLKLKEN